MPPLFGGQRHPAALRADGRPTFAHHHRTDTAKQREIQNRYDDIDLPLGGQPFEQPSTKARSQYSARNQNSPQPHIDTVAPKMRKHA